MIQRERWIVCIVLALALVACGGGAETEPASESDTNEVVVEQVTPEPTPEEESGLPSNLVCQDPPPYELALGKKFNGEITEEAGNQCFWVNIPEGLELAAFELTGLSGDLSLAVGYGFLVTVQYHVGEFWRIDDGDLTDEILMLDNPNPGPYFIKVSPAGAKVDSPFSLEVNTEPEITTAASGTPLPEFGTCAPPAVAMELNSSVESQIAAREQRPLTRDYFCVQVPNGLDRLSIEINDPDGGLDLFVRRVSPAQWYERSGAIGVKSIVIEEPMAGAYYIDVEEQRTGVQVSYSLAVSGGN